MKSIQAEFKRSKTAQAQVSPVRFFGNRHKEDREWQVLGAICRLLKEGGFETPHFAKKRESPDFHTFTKQGGDWLPIEIVEVLPDGYRRQDEYRKERCEEVRLQEYLRNPLADPWITLRKRVQEKAAKKYAARTCLGIYFDIGRFSFSGLRTPFHDQLLTEHSVRPFAGVNSFKGVLVLNSDMASLIELYPNNRVIVPDDPDPLTSRSIERHIE